MLGQKCPPDVVSKQDLKNRSKISIGWNVFFPVKLVVLSLVFCLGLWETRMLFIDSEEKKTCYQTSYRGWGGNGWVSDCLNIMSGICQRMTACPGYVLTWKSRYWAALIQSTHFLLTTFSLFDKAPDEQWTTQNVELPSDSRGGEATTHWGELNPGSGG